MQLKVPTCHPVHKLLHRSIYGRVNIYSNEPLIFNRRLSDQETTTVKQLDVSELNELIAREKDTDFSIIPRRFVFVYSLGDYTREDYDDETLHNFTDGLQSSTRYFQLIENLEVEIDYCYESPKDYNDCYEARSLSYILKSPSIFASLTSLSINKAKFFIDGSKLTKLLALTLHQFINLDQLFIGSSDLTSIDNFRLSRKLTSLDLIDNKIKSIPGDSNFFPPGLKTLNLSLNKLVDLSGIYFGDKLRYLDISLNSIKRLSNIDWPESLQILMLSGNELEFYNEIVKFPNFLQYLSLLKNPHIISLNGLKLPPTLQRIFIDVAFEGLPIDVPRKDSIIYA